MGLCWMTKRRVVVNNVKVSGGMGRRSGSAGNHLTPLEASIPRDGSIIELDVRSFDSMQVGI